MDEEGMAGDLKGIKWETLDMTTITQKDMEQWETLIIPFLKKHTKAEIYERALEHEMLMAPAYNIKELEDYPQLTERGYWKQVWYEDLDTRITHPGAFCQMSGSPIRPPLRAPFIGENNKEIYAGELEMSEKEIELYKSQGII